MQARTHLSILLWCGVVMLTNGWALADKPPVAQRQTGKPAAVHRRTAADKSPAAQQQTNKQALPKSEMVSFFTDEKVAVKIVGTYMPPVEVKSNATRAPGVVLVHMYDKDRSTFDPLAGELQAAGFAVLAIDLRGHGQSIEPASLKLRAKAEQRDPRTVRNMVHDVQSACEWLARRPEVDPARLAVVGAGLGGSVALEYAARDRSIDGLVILTPVLDDWAMDTRVPARKYRNRPALFLTAQEEREPADELAREIPEAKVDIVGPRPAGQHSMALHGTRMLGQAAEVEKTIIDFLTQAVGEAGDKPVVASVIGQVYYEPNSTQANRLSPSNLRTFNSAAEAEARGYRPPKRRSK